MNVRPMLCTDTGRNPSFALLKVVSEAFLVMDFLGTGTLLIT
jgi:hypothetical protein